MNGRLKAWLVGVSAVAAIAAGIGAATAADESENIIKYRQNVMSAVGGHMGAIGAVVKGEVTFTGHVGAHAESLAAMSRTVVELFPQGSTTGAETRAKDEIWQDWDDFQAKAGDFTAAADNLVQVANSGGDAAAIEAAFGDVGKSCGGCHRPYRARAN